jgi:transposase-like protein
MTDAEGIAWRHADTSPRSTRIRPLAIVLDSGRPIAEVARSSGVHEMTWGKWVKKARDSGRVPDKDLSEN